MPKAVICPVCNGSGCLFIPPSPDSASVTGYFKECHGCGGKGWVIVPEMEYYEKGSQNAPLTTEGDHNK